MKKLSVKELAYVGLFAAIICVVSQFSIPMPYGVPMTLQTLIIPLVAFVMGPRIGSLATLVYVLLGAFGLPVFAGFQGGVGIVFGPTGGFILSFPLMAYLAGWGGKKEGHLIPIFYLFLATLVNYIIGMFMFSLITSSDLKTAFIACVAPFILTSIGKIFLVDLLGKTIQGLLVKHRVRV